MRSRCRSKKLEKLKKIKTSPGGIEWNGPRSGGEEKKKREGERALSTVMGSRDRKVAAALTTPAADGE